MISVSCVLFKGIFPFYTYLVGHRAGVRVVLHLLKRREPTTGGFRMLGVSREFVLLRSSQ